MDLYEHGTWEGLGYVTSGPVSIYNYLKLGFRHASVQGPSGQRHEMHGPKSQVQVKKKTYRVVTLILITGQEGLSLRLMVSVFFHESILYTNTVYTAGTVVVIVVVEMLINILLLHTYYILKLFIRS